MKNLLIYLFSAFIFAGISGVSASAIDAPLPKNVVSLEIPAQNPQKSEIKFGNETVSETSLPEKILTEKNFEASSSSETVKSSEVKIKNKIEKSDDLLKKNTTDIKKTSEKAVDDAKNAAEKTGDSARNAARAARNATESAAVKTKQIAQKTVDVTKNAADKTASATKKATRNTIDGTKDFVDSVNPARPLTKEDLDAASALKTLKSEKKEINSAFKSRIKDVDAKIKSAENTTSVSDVQKRNLIYELNKEKNKLEREKASYIEKYDQKIEVAKQNKRGNNK